MKFDKTGGFRWLDSWVMASIIQLATFRTLNMLSHQLRAQGDKFAKSGGFREKLAETRVKARAEQENAPVCPDCGRPMKRRKALAGRNAGKEFWGCTGYPSCRGLRQLEVS